ncbi:UDP-N-acetylglucosamine 1-carboxyvinyltransferase [Patescibacteria group bacterium]|nr:UDP-N-acetylglucosamine 1-carboxyvinyltransferase [Patescibacteria group bacterium]
MPKFIIRGGKPLNGEVFISGSKNAALPILCATLLTDEECVISNVPDIADVKSMLSILKTLGAKVSYGNETVKIRTLCVNQKNIPSEAICKMRASILLLGALIGRCKEAKISFPGGCVLGKRSVFAHTATLSELGCEILDETRNLHLKASALKGTKIIMPELSVTATENLIMASVLAEGVTKVHLAAAEPHVQDLCNMLNKMGAKISGIGTNALTIEGVLKLHGVSHSIVGDYLEAGTFAISGVITKGNIKVTRFNPDHLDSLWQKLREIGADFTLGENFVEIRPVNELKAAKILRTAVYPSFPTDLQAPFTVLLSQANGVSKVFETLFEGRLNYLFELERMGAKMEFLNPHQAIIIGPTPLKGAPISSCDIRAGAAMVVAALAASGETEISNVYYIDRGYADLDEKLRALGADITRLNRKNPDRTQGGLDRFDHSDRFAQHQTSAESQNADG